GLVWVESAGRRRGGGSLMIYESLGGVWGVPSPRRRRGGGSLMISESLGGLFGGPVRRRGRRAVVDVFESLGAVSGVESGRRRGGRFVDDLRVPGVFGVCRIRSRGAG
ncbi:hypothetical protein H0E87_031522, partial [Populus deltoides]